VTVTSLTVGITVSTNSTSSDVVTVTSLTVGKIVTTTALALMQYLLLALSWRHNNYYSTNSVAVPVTTLQFASLYLNSTSSDAIPVTCLRVPITLPTTSLTLMKYRLLA
jgi:hypothetical protein